MESGIQKLLRKNIRDLKPYSSARDEYSGHSGIFLDANENSLGTPGRGFYHRYPDPGQQRLKREIADLKACSPEQIFLGNGSDEAVDLLIRAFCEPGLDSITILPPTYGMYSVAAAVNNVAVNEIPLTPDFRMDDRVLEAITASDSKLLFICSPNNPSGNLMDRESVTEAAGKFRGITVLDEAYIDFADEKSRIGDLENFPRLAVLQTFSKAWGMAGARLGMAFADPEIITVLNRIKYPYNINALTQEAVMDVIGNHELMTRNLGILRKEREKMKERLSDYPFVKKIHPSDANFLLVRVEDADDLYDFLLGQQIIVRNRSSQLHCADCLRITVGTPEENETLFDILDGY